MCSDTGGLGLTVLVESFKRCGLADGLRTTGGGPWKRCGGLSL